MIKGKTKVAVIGAGFVGATCAYAMAIRGTCAELVLIDVAADKAAGEADDIKQGMPYFGSMNIYSGDYSAVKGADVIVITAGANRKPGETRLDLARKNARIAKTVTESIMEHYNGGVILVVANPVDILTYMISKWTGLPKGMVLGTGTSLDTVRFRSAIADITGIDATNVHGYIIGEHGDSQVAAWSNTHIAGIQIDAYCKQNGILLNNAVKDDILEQVKTDGARIIQRKGATYFGIAICVATLVGSLLRDHNTIRTVSTIMDGAFGVDDVALSLPTVIGSTGAKSVHVPPLHDSEISLFVKSAEACSHVLSECLKV